MRVDAKATDNAKRTNSRNATDRVETCRGLTAPSLARRSSAKKKKNWTNMRVIDYYIIGDTFCFRTVTILGFSLHFTFNGLMRCNKQDI